MKKENEIDNLAREIQRSLLELESAFWDTFVGPTYHDEPLTKYEEYQRDDKETWLYHGTRQLYYKICLFFELKGLPMYLSLFIEKFGKSIDNRKEVLKDRGPLYEEAEPSMIIHDEFRDYLLAFPEFDNGMLQKKGSNKLLLILENTNQLIANSKFTIRGEPSIYNVVKWFIEIVYPSTRRRNKARFISKFKKYDPDILIPEINSAIEYKLVKKGKNAADYLDELKTDADNYINDPEYKFFYAIVFYEEKSELNKASFESSIEEKMFPENWIIIAL